MLPFRGITPCCLRLQSEEELGLKNKRGDAHFSTGRPIQTVPNGVDDILNTHIIRCVHGAGSVPQHSHVASCGLISIGHRAARIPPAR